MLQFVTRRFLALLVLLLFYALAATAQTPPVQTETRTWVWTQATGPVGSYGVFVTRDGGPWTLEQTVPADTPQVTIERAPTEAVAVQVQALSTDGRIGPLSQPSDPLSHPKDQPQVGQPGQPVVITITIDAGGAPVVVEPP